jgi:hypothetical protein
MVAAYCTVPPLQPNLHQVVPVLSTYREKYKEAYSTLRNIRHPRILGKHLLYLQIVGHAHISGSIFHETELG